MIQYDLITGLTALGAYGVLLIANNELIKAGHEALLNTQNEPVAVLGLFLSSNLVIAGLTILATTLIRVISSSSLQIIATEKWTAYSAFVLVFPLIIPQIWFFGSVISLAVEGDMIGGRLKGVIAGIYGLLVSLLIGQNFSRYISVYVLYVFAIPFLPVLLSLRNTKLKN